MGIETLQKAAQAAGYAMATPDDEPWTKVDSVAPGPRQTLPALLQRRPSRLEAMTTAASWIRDHLPLMGGRAPA